MVISAHGLTTQNFLCLNLTELGTETVINSDLLKNCYVTLCRAKGKNFWLITKSEMNRSRCLSILNANIDVDAILDIWEKEGIQRAAQVFKDFIISKDEVTTPERINKEGNKKPNKSGKEWTHKEPMALTNSLPFIDDIQEIDMNEIEDWDLLSVDDVDLEEPGGFEFDPDERT